MAYGLNPLSLLGAGTAPGPNELMMNDLLAQLAARAASAQGAAAGAQQQYATAASEPEPNVYAQRPGAAAGAMGLSRIAEGLGAADAPAQTRATISDQQKTLRARRAQHLESLARNYEMLAKRANETGDLEMEVKQRTLADRVTKEHQQLLERTGNDAAMARLQTSEAGAASRNDADNAAALTRQTAGDAAAMSRLRLEESGRTTRAGIEAGARGASAGAELDTWAEELASGTATIANIPFAQRGAVLAHMKSRGLRIIPLPARKALNELSGADASIKAIESLSGRIHTGQRGGATAIAGQTIKRGLQSATQSNADATEYNRLRGALAGNLARAVAAERGVLTEQDRKFAMGLIPKLGDSQEVARRNINQLKTFLKSRRESAKRSFASADPAGADPALDPLGIR